MIIRELRQLRRASTWRAIALALDIPVVDAYRYAHGGDAPEAVASRARHLVATDWIGDARPSQPVPLIDELALRRARRFA